MVSRAFHFAATRQSQVEREAVSRIARDGERLALGIPGARLVFPYIAGCGGQRHPEAPAGAIRTGELYERGLHAYFLVRLNPGDPKREDIRALARGQRRLPAGLHRFLVFLLRLLALLQLGSDFHLSEADPDRRDRRIAREREAIERLQHEVAFRVRILEALPALQRGK